METILVVDDNINNIRLLDKLLKLKGYRVAISKSGDEALEICTRIVPDLIILDIMMEGMDGYETCRSLKKIEELKSIPVIFLSSLTQTQNKVEGFKAGGVDYITKPIDSEELYIRVETHISINRLKKQMEADLLEKDKLLKENIKKTEELITTQKDLFNAEKISSLGFLVSGMAHEINTPLSVCITSNSLILDKLKTISNKCGGDIEAIKDCTKLISGNLSRIDSMIREFKDLSITHMTQVSSDFNILNTLEKSASIIKNVLNRGDIDITIYGDDHRFKDSYPEALEKVIHTLIENSIIHGFKEVEAPEISIEVSDKVDCIQIDYKDNGSGIPTEILNNIFLPFFTTSRSKGTGLGLSVAYNQITQQLSGTIYYMDDCSGAHFRIILPKQDNHNL